MAKNKIGIIGGSGIYDLGLPLQKKSIATPYSKKPVIIFVGNYKGIEVVFLNRHGESHSLSPHLINYRANIFAMRKEGVKTLIAVSAVGAISLRIKPGDFVIMDQFIDFTKSRQSTFFKSCKSGSMYTDMTNPFCEMARQVIIEAASEIKIKCINGGTIAVCEGPRYETAAEIRAYKILGADIVGMTTFPEAVLAKEADICYAVIGIASNYAAGIFQKTLVHEEVLATINQRKKDLRELILKSLEILHQKSC